MITIRFRDPVGGEVERVLEQLEAGGARVGGLESRLVDLKEEAGRRQGSGPLQAGEPRSERVAKQLAAEAACFANTPGGGALIVGVADSGEVTGAATEAEWLRRRIYELSESRLTVEVSEAVTQGKRLLVVRCPQALEPIPFHGKYTWRVDDRCVPMDPTSWHERRRELEGYDWSVQDSGVTLGEVRPQALLLARRYLMDGGGADLAVAPDAELLRRLNVVAASGSLTNAGAITFVSREAPAIDYMRRAGAGLDSQRRLRSPGLSLLEELDAVEQAIEQYNEVRQVSRGLVVAQLREIPPRAAREAIVNGAVHRDWHSPHPTTVEHIGSTLSVTSPGGFVGGVTSENILTHPSRPRYRALAELFAALGIAEREGIGVDRMTRDMVAVGYPAPVIVEAGGPVVRATLHGGNPDPAWIHFVGLVREQDSHSPGLIELLLLRDLVINGWTDPARAALALQQSPEDARRALESLEIRSVAEGTLLARVSGVPEGFDPAWVLSKRARRELEGAYSRESGSCRARLAGNSL